MNIPSPLLGLALGMVLATMVNGQVFDRRNIGRSGMEQLGGNGRLLGQIHPRWLNGIIGIARKGRYDEKRGTHVDKWLKSSMPWKSDSSLIG